MTGFLDACGAPANLVLTILLSVCVLYWLMVVVRALKIDTLDVDFDADADADARVAADADADADAEADVDANADADAEADVDGHTPYPRRVGVAILRFLNVGEVPVMVPLTVAIVGMWVLGVSLHPFIGRWLLPWRLLLLIPQLGVALLVTGSVTTPLRDIFRKLRAT